MDNEKSSNNSEQSDNRSYHYYRGPRIWGMLVFVFIIAVIIVAVGNVGNRHRMNRSEVTFVRSGMMDSGGFRGGHARMGGAHGAGITGSITAINGNAITLHTTPKDYTVNIQTTTSLYNNGDIAKQSDLKTGDIVTVFGMPDSSGNITANFIRIQ